jgi:hypothetical protein
VAGALEQVARAVKEGRRTWDEGTRQLAIRAVDDLRRFVRKAREWTDADTQEARGVASMLEGIGGRQPAARPSRETPDAGTRAFVAREGAALASAVARAAELIARTPHSPDALQPVRQVMQPLRGLATLAELPPLPDLLEGVDRAASAIQRGGDPRGDGATALDAAAKALTQATREVTSAGRADPDAVEVRRFAEAVRRLLGLDAPAVPIESLYFDDAGPHVVEAGTSPPTGPKLGEVELVALGEHLKQVAVGVTQTTSATLRGLRALAAADSLRTLELNADEQLRSGARAFARAGRDALARDLAASHPEAFAGALRSAGEALATGSTQSLSLARELTKLASTLESAGAEPAAAPAAGPHPTPVTHAPEPIRSSAPGFTPVAAATQADLERETNDLAGGLLRYERLVTTQGFGLPSLQELLAGASAEAPPRAAPQARPSPAAVPLTAEFDLAERGRPPQPPAAPAAAQPVPISALCYSGAAALHRALSLREELNRLVSQNAPAEAITDLSEEIFDLVKLGLDGN